MLTDIAIYLGESKWQRSSERIRNGVLRLRKEQIIRHAMFKFYVEEWVFAHYDSWQSFRTLALPKLLAKGSAKLIPSADRQLAKNLQIILDLIKQRYAVLPTIRNVLLFLQEGAISIMYPKRPVQISKLFQLIILKGYSKVLSGFSSD